MSVMIPINDNFSFALRAAAKSRGESSFSAAQLFNALSDYGAFIGFPLLKFVVKTLLNDGIWNDIVDLYIDKGYRVNKADHIREVIQHKYGFSDFILNLIFHAIFSIDDWDNENYPTDNPDVLHFENIPIGGTSYTFRKRLIKKGYYWDNDLQCLTGTFNGIPNCQIICNESCSEYPVYFVKVNLPISVNEEETKRLVARLLCQEESRINQLGIGLRHDPYIEYERIRFKRNHDSTYRIVFSDDSNHGIMIESCSYEPTNESLSKLKIL